MTSQGRGRVILPVLLLLALPCKAFLPNFWSRVLTLSWDSHTHQYITEQAILNVTMETMRDTKTHQGSHAEERTRLGRGFWRAVGEVVKSNAAMDFLSSTRSDPVYHFDSERVDSATGTLRQLWAQTLLSVRAKEFQSARHSLGQLFHSLQDFYSHSNWVEMGHRFIYLHLLQPEEPATPTAQDDTPTCMECFSSTCRDNLLLTSSQLLTTGYFSSLSPKPHGKCSHGGILDSSRYLGAKGGINKDSTSPVFSPHHYLHEEAASLAMEATLSVLRDLRDTVGPRTFLRFLSVQQVPALVFVMDTTGSMFEEITAARYRALSIIQARASGSGQPGTFLLVPFHDPDVGPVYETSDPEEFMQHMEGLMALGGGDEPEMCLSAVQLALTHSPPLSDIFVFTDASPKDAHLFDAVKALALEKQSKVTFLLTEDSNYTSASRARRKRRRRRRREPLSADRFSLYSSLSSASGGLTIFTTNSDIRDVSAIVEDNTAGDKVTLLHVESDQQLTSSHSFRVDSSVKSVTLHVTGVLTACSLTSPSDHSQALLTERGPLAQLEHFQGLYRIKLLSPVQPGQWSLEAESDGQLTFSVIGDSSLDFLYYFATVTNETHPGLERVAGSPVAGAPAFLVVAVTGVTPGEEVSFSHVTLLGAEGESLQQVELHPTSSSYSAEELVGKVDAVPIAPFSVRLTGRDGRGNKLERVSTETVQPTRVQIQVLSAPRLVPGHSTTVAFSVLNHGPARLFSLTADDDCGYLYQRGPHRFHVAERDAFHGQVGLLAPAAAQAGATVTLTLAVHALDSLDSNYAVAYLSVIPPDPDSAPPSCSAAHLHSNCSSICNESSWSLSLVVSDQRSGLAALQLQRGQGVLAVLHRPPPSGDRERTSSEGLHHHVEAELESGDAPLNVSGLVLGSAQPLWVTYTSSCCSARAELLVWDTAGNMKRCHLTSGQQRQQRDRSAETSGAGRVSSSFLLLCWFLLQNEVIRDVWQVKL